MNSNKDERKTEKSIETMSSLIQEVIDELERTRGSETIKIAVRLLKSMNTLQKQTEKLSKNYLLVTAQIQAFMTERSELLWIMKKETEILQIMHTVGINWGDFPKIEAMLARAEKIIEYYDSKGDIPEENPFIEAIYDPNIGDPNSGVPFMHKCTDPAIFPMKVEEDEDKSEYQLREDLAALEHEQWAHWTRYMLDNMSDENIKRWRQQIDTPYSELSEQEKESDRNWADKVIEKLEASKAESLIIHNRAESPMIHNICARWI